jgi:peptide/nickel transport system ATP-binding protein
MAEGPTPVLRIEELHVGFRQGSRELRAVQGVSFQVSGGEAVAVIGESGSGKSVTLRTIMRLSEGPRTTVRGRLEVQGRNVLALSPRELARLRGGEVAMVFQEPLLALDPVFTLGHQIVEAIRAHEPVGHATAQARALSLFTRVGIPSPERRLKAYASEMSGGMRQRAMIALALSCGPRLLLADEPTTALDATVQIQVLLLLRELQREFGLSVVFVTHDIGAAIEIADRIVVMYAGRVVEQASTADLLRRPRHPYTQALLGMRHRDPGSRGKVLRTIEGSPPDLASLPEGCAFASRCPHATAPCKVHQPVAVQVASNHQVSCHHAEAVR